MVRAILKKIPILYAAYIRLLMRKESAQMQRAEREGERRFHAYCVGAAKTGTTSLALLFSENFRAAHEPMSHHFNLTWGGRAKIEGDRFDSYLEQRDRYLNLEMEASHNVLPAVPALVRLYPEAKFILTVRECLSWMESLISEELDTRENRDSYLWWQPWFRHTCGAAAGHPTEEKVLADVGLSTVRGYMRYWARHNREVLAAVPEERLLIVRLDQLDESHDRMAEFLGIDPNTLPKRESRANTRSDKAITVDCIGRDYVERIAQEECGELMAQFFPEK